MSNLAIVNQQIELAREAFEQNVEKLKLDLNFQKEASFALQVFQDNKYLSGANPESIKNAIVNVSLTGLTLNPVMKMAYLVPRKGKCCLDPSYMGLIKILTDTGSVKSIEAHVVHANEPFELMRGTDGFVKHGLAPTANKGDIIGCYSVATLNDGSKSIEWMYVQDINAIAMRSEGVKAGRGTPWNTDYSEMARKTVVKRHYKYLPKSDRAILASQAIALDDENNGIDFKEEQKASNFNLDVLDPNNPDAASKYVSMIEFIKNALVPDDYFRNLGMDRESFYNAVSQEFNSGTMPVAKADNIYNSLLQYAPK